MRSDRDEVKQALKDRIQDLCRHLLPDGQVRGRLWVAHNPVMMDHAWTPEFKVALDRDVGAWRCWRAGESGDVIGLIEYVLATDFRGAMAFAREFLGLRTMSREQRVDFSARNAERRRQAEQEAQQRAAERRKAVARLWEQGAGLAVQSAAARTVHRYLGEGRGCPLDRVPNLDPLTFRAAADLENWELAQWEVRDGRRRKTMRGPTFPALLSAFRAPTGHLTAVHCTFLDPAKPAKAPVPGRKAKLMFGEALGAVIRISHGPEGKPPEAAGEEFPLILCEGVEDGLSLAIAVPEARVWAGGSLAGMGGAPVDLPCVSAVFVAADNDWNNRTAVEQFDKVLVALEAHGKPVEVMRSAIGKDFNDGMTD